jgi:Ca2+-binding RTX toxin-like protein
MIRRFEFLRQLDPTQPRRSTPKSKLRKLRVETLEVREMFLFSNGGYLYDFGDAPDSYGTLLATNGAQHDYDNVLFLGTAVDGDVDGQPTLNADGDDAVVSQTNFDDEDGVVLPGTFIAQASATISVTASTAGGKLDAWIDFNRNGTFDLTEQIANSVVVFAGNNNLTVNVPATVSAGLSYARFRLSTAGGLPPTGVAPTGEVEDYAVTLAAPAPGTVTVLPDPQTPGQNVLFIVGTANPDAIVVQPVPGQPTQTRVVFPGLIFGPFANASYQRIEVFGLGGSDAIAVDAAFTVPAHLHGNDGNDSIVGGSGNDIIYGDAGFDSLAGSVGNDVILGGNDADYLYGGLGNDVLIGGLGADWLYGQEGDDLLIGGSTIFDGDVNTLKLIQASWSAPASFNTRIASLSSLNAGSVINDGVADYLLGSVGRDWALDFALLDLFLDFDANATTGDKKN